MLKKVERGTHAYYIRQKGYRVFIVYQLFLQSIDARTNLPVHDADHIHDQINLSDHMIFFVGDASLKDCISKECHPWIEARKYRTSMSKSRTNSPLSFT